MQVRHTIDATAVRELGKILDELTYGIYTVSVTKNHRRNRRNRNNRCARPVSPGIHASADTYTYTITNLMKPRGQQKRTFTGHNAALDAMSYILGLIAGKRELCPATATRVRYWDEAVRQQLRQNSAHYADDAWYSATGRHEMCV
ncbi:hypothetical protein F4561_005220 [Lipingzhangella halophila]|uniref:Uncharacterized protein n=1 Tax=Lipingzhangella halophila TaxID=1783352 RepID=A0A7W7RLW4_9ACTN|nr:hypothetical protein [Lipingzhangella halophila]MBB4934400.1 hypothetical protein [Lipingzhangella halophila]